MPFLDFENLLERRHSPPKAIITYMDSALVRMICLRSESWF